MEDLFLNREEHQIIKKFKKRLESLYCVKIYIPNENSATDKDLIFGSIYGNDDSIKKVKKFLQKKMNRPVKSRCPFEKNDILLVTLSDSEGSNISSSSDEDAKIISKSPIFNSSDSFKEKKHLKDMYLQADDSLCILDDTNILSKSNLKESCVKNPFSIDDSICIIESTISSNDDTSVSNCVNTSLESTLPMDSSSQINESVCIIGSLENSCKSPNDTSHVYSYTNLDDTFQSPNDSVCIIDCISPLDRRNSSKTVTKNKKRVKKNMSDDSISQFTSTNDIHICEVSSTTEQPSAKRMKLSNDETNCFKKTETAQKSVQKQLTSWPSEFIPLEILNKSNARSVNNTGKKMTVTISRTENDVSKQEIQNTSRRLRPIVIDGSNVAREHGKSTATFSSKGIQLCVDYFLKRGHKDVKVFIPKFRKHGEKRKFYPTTDTEILDELEKKQHLVYTPSRNINGKCYASYDDRFMVQLAAKNGGVLVSNDNFNDLINESPTYKEAIEKRLLMYCFVDDLFMIPEDPLGKKGPNLAEYLSFPPDEEVPKV